MREARGRRARCRPYRSAQARLTAQGRITMKFAVLCTMLVLMLAAQTGFGQEKPYKEGSVWTVTFVKVKPGMMDTYLRGFTLTKRSEEHTSELQSLAYLVCRLLLEKKKKKKNY